MSGDKAIRWSTVAVVAAVAAVAAVVSYRHVLLTELSESGPACRPVAALGDR
jgi:hypothetical protein